MYFLLKLLLLRSLLKYTSSQRKRKHYLLSPSSQPLENETMSFLKKKNIFFSLWYLFVCNDKIQIRVKKILKPPTYLPSEAKPIGTLAYSLPDFSLCSTYHPPKHFFLTKRGWATYTLLCNLLIHLKNILLKVFQDKFRNTKPRKPLHYSSLCLHKIPLSRYTKFYLFSPGSGCFLSFITMNSSNKHPPLYIRL